MKPDHRKASPLPPPPGQGCFVYGQDPITGEMTDEPVAVKDAVSVPFGLYAEYLAAYGLRQVSKPFDVGADWVVIVEKEA